MSDCFVQVKNLSFQFLPDQWLFKDLSFTIDKGACLGITGRSGCGKSTLAQIVAGHIEPQKGSIVVDGHRVNGRPQRDVFLVHQDTDLFPWQTVQQQIAFALKSPSKEKVEDLVRLTKLKGFEHYYPRQLSGGMKKRLAIARALAVQPKLIIFDETFSALDFDLRMEMFSELKGIWHTTHTTILLISHDPRDLQEIAGTELRLK